jgi:hypothetical protein
MAKLPVISGHELIRALQRDGFQIVRQRGSHVSLMKGVNTGPSCLCTMNWPGARCWAFSSSVGCRKNNFLIF